MSADCPTTARLESLLHGLPTAEDAGVAAHLDACAECQRRLEALTGDTTLWQPSMKRDAGLPDVGSAHLRRVMNALQSSRPAEKAFLPRLDFLEPADQPGVLGRFCGYDVIAHVASGGMGIVLEGRDPRLQRVVALKLLSPILAANELARARFLREARSAASVSHEHVVPIYAVDEWHGLPFLVMQFIEGETLGERIRKATADRGPGAIGPVLPFAEILRVGAETASGLSAAHQQGLIHRDIKPGNILLEGDAGSVKLTDFGLARAADDAQLTSPGELAGTPEYMSPEQAGESEVDARSDLFSLGVVLYAMATGASPFHAPTNLGTMRRVCDFEPPPLSGIVPAIPPAFSRLVQRLMSKSPAARPQSAADILRQLSEWRAHPPSGDVQETGPGRRVLIGTAAALVALALPIGWWAKHSGTAAGRPGGHDDSRWSFVVQDAEGVPRLKTNSLAGAVAGSQSGETIEIQGHGRLPMAPVAISGKALRLRASGQESPILVATNTSEALITTDAALALEGVKLEYVFDAVPFEMRRGQTPPGLQHHVSVVEMEAAITTLEEELPAALVRSTGDAPLSFSHCRLHYRGHHGLRPSASAGCVELAGIGRCTIAESELIALNATCVRWSPGPTDDLAAGLSRVLVVSNSVLAGRLVLNPLAPGTPIEVSLARSTINAADLVAVHGSAAIVRIDSRECLFDTRWVLHELRSGRADPIAERVRWQDSLCHFTAGSGFVGRQRMGTVFTLPEWNAIWNQQETGSRIGAVRYPDMVARTADLRNLKARHFKATTDTGVLKDMGAFVDAVGPDEPYLRWRQGK